MIHNHWSHIVLEETCTEENKISNFKLGLIILSCEDIIGLLRLKETSDIICFSRLLLYIPLPAAFIILLFR